MHLKLIACNVFLREVCYCVARSPHVIDLEFTELGAHTHPDQLRATLQAAIDRASDGARDYDAVLVLFGLCGNAGAGLQARQTKLVMPRAHDCCTVLLGSRQRFHEHFGDAPSTPFSSAGYMDRGDYFLRVEEGEFRLHYGDAYAEYVAKYGEETARYIWEQMHPPGLEEKTQAVFIELPETGEFGHAERFHQQAAAEGRECRQVEGDLRLISGLVNGDWPAEEFLIVEPGQETLGVYDWDEVIRARNIGEE